jgi:hypothetical protein
MLADIIGSYLDTLEEREFDAPFLAILRALGFYDLHFLHGAFEFGKDFIAKAIDGGVPCQFVFQTKAGDVDLAGWRTARGQIDDLRTNALAHPSFDRNLARRAVFVTTGRLTGAAPLSAQEYKEHLEKLGEITVTVWDREGLIEIMQSDPSIGLAGVAEGEFLKLLGKIDVNEVLDADLERYSRRWYGGSGVQGLWRSAVEASALANRLRRHRRLDLACFVPLCLIRGAWACSHGAKPPDRTSLAVADAGRRLFRHYALDIWLACGEDTLDAKSLMLAHEPLQSHVTYPVRCARLCEVLGLLGLLELQYGTGLAHGIAGFLSRFLKSNPGATHPISDRWAVSLIPPILLLSKSGDGGVCREALKGVTKWIGDRYDRGGLGLAKPNATPDEEVRYLLGSPFEHVSLTRRAGSYLATVVLDLASVLGMSDIFEIARNEFLAVDAEPSVVEAGDTPSQYLQHGPDLTLEPYMVYEQIWAPVDGWKTAPHHKREPEDYYLGRIGRLWDHLAVRAVLRDRHFSVSSRSLIQNSPSLDSTDSQSHLVS